MYNYFMVTIWSQTGEGIRKVVVVCLSGKLGKIEFVILRHLGFKFIIFKMKKKHKHCHLREIQVQKE